MVVLLLWVLPWLVWLSVVVLLVYHCVGFGGGMSYGGNEINQL
jgi:hypothetical protein